MNNIKEYIDNNFENFLELLSRYVAIKSVSSDPKCKSHRDEAVAFLMKVMKEAGLQNVQRLPNEDRPVVYSEWVHKEDKPTILFYGHYDVQPSGKRREWDTDPFRLVKEGDEMFARGVADNKAPHLAHILAVKALLDVNGELPVNVKFIIEGGEEMGSPGFDKVVKEHKELLKSDVAFVSDGVMNFDAPVIEYGLRGLMAFELTVQCLDKDVHSGSYGGVVDNSAIVLADIISKLKDRDGRITIPEIYEQVREVNEEEREILNKVETSDSEIKEITGAKKIFGEDDLLNIERTGARPTLEVHGLLSGHTDEGTKTIIPHKASAKMSMRLVPNMTVEDTWKKIEKYIESITPDTAEVTIKRKESCDPVIFDRRSEVLAKAGDVLSEVFDSRVKYTLVGGSIGAVLSFKDELNVDTISTGFSLPDCGMHSPNEKFLKSHFKKAMETTYKYLEALS